MNIVLLILSLFALVYSMFHKERWASVFSGFLFLSTVLLLFQLHGNILIIATSFSISIYAILKRNYPLKLRWVIFSLGLFSALDMFSKFMHWPELPFQSFALLIPVVSFIIWVEQTNRHKQFGYLLVLFCILLITYISHFYPSIIN